MTVTPKRPGKEAALKALRGLMKGGPETVDQRIFTSYLRDESDRGAIILAATMVDDALRVALQRSLPGLNSDEKARIFDHQGPLGTFSSRILMAHGLELVTRSVRRAIETIKEMRNVAAHAHLMIDFSTPEIRAAFSTMFENEQGDDVYSWPSDKMRNMFLLICGLYADQLIDPQSANRPMINTRRMLAALDERAME